MRLSSRQFLHVALASAVTITLLAGCATERERKEEAAKKSAEQQAFETAVDAYIYGYPLVTMEMTRRVMTNVVAPEGTHAPMGRLANVREYPTAAFRDITAPNADTLYSFAWVDLSKEPYVLSLPDEHGRYYLFPILRTSTLCCRSAPPASCTSRLPARSIRAST